MIRKFSVTKLMLISTLFTYAQNARPVEGVWKSQDQQSLIVSVNGQSNPAAFVYFSAKGKFLPFRFSGDSLIHLEPDGTRMFMTVSGDGKTITDATSGAPKTFTKTDGTSPVNCKSIPGGADDFFDFSTTNYYAGINFYLSPHPGLPFMPNPAFISKHKTGTIKVQKLFARISPEGEQSVKEYDLVYNFNGGGQVSSVEVIPFNSTQEKDVWTFAYSGDKLTKVTSPGRTLQFDGDNWEVDANQQKKVPYVFPLWNYNGSQRPQSATLPEAKGPLNEYYYNEQNQLVKVCSKDESEPNILEHCTLYSYDKNGLLDKIIEMKRSK